MNDTKQDLLDYLKKINIEADFSNIEKFSTVAIADGFHISRSLASQYLNSLFREGKIVKIDSRPVYYISRFVFERDFDIILNSLSFSSLDEAKEYLLNQKKMRYSFENLVGFDGSLGETISQIKSAVSYPSGSGLNYLLYGEVGVGKSILSKCAYEYLLLQTKEEKKRVICDGRNDRFIRRFCEAIEEAKEGVVVIKRGNYISEEDRKLLSRILENNYFINDAGKRVYLSCSIVLLYDKPTISELEMIVDYFPIKCHVPAYRNRYSAEKERIIIRFFKKEAHILSKDIQISYALMKFLINANYPHNLDDLNNIVKEVCARASIESAKTLYIGVNHLPERFAYNGNAFHIKEADLKDEWISVNDYIQPDASEGVIALFDNIIKEFQSADASIGNCIKNCCVMLNKFYDEFIYNNQFNSDFTFSYNSKFEDVINSVVYAYNYIVPEHCSLIISYYCFVKKTISRNIDDWYIAKKQDIQKVVQQLVNTNSEITILVEKIKLAFAYNINISLDDAGMLILYIMFLNYNNLNSNRQFLSLIICHGVSTAYSISNTVNSFVGQHVYESVDMPLDKTMADVAEYVSKYVKRYRIKSDILLLVDMGALEELDTHLKEIENNIYVLNNVSTPMALTIATMVIQNESLNKIADVCAQRFGSSFKACKNRRKEDALIFVSDNGKNMALRLKDTFINSLPKHIDVQTFACNRVDLEMTDFLSKIKENYNILFILGASSFENCQNFISIENLVKEREIDRITELLRSYLNKEEVMQFRENLIYNFSLQSVIDNLSVLDANKVLLYTKNAVSLLQKEMHYNFLSDVLPGIYIHICFMVERLVTKEPIAGISDDSEFEREHKNFVNITKKCFQNLCSHYGVELTVAEIKYLYEYIEDDRRKKENE